MEMGLIQIAPTIMSDSPIEVLQGIISLSEKGVPVLVTEKFVERFGDKLRELGVRFMPLGEGELPSSYVLLQLSGVIVNVVVVEDGVKHEKKVNVRKFEEAINTLLNRKRRDEARDRPPSGLYYVVLPDELKELIESAGEGPESGGNGGNGSGEEL